MRYIDRAGVELEGGWNLEDCGPDCCHCDWCENCNYYDDCDYNHLPQDCGACDSCRENLSESGPEGFKEDSSVRVDGVSFEGECISDPYKNIDKLAAWIKEKYPDKVNSSCGFHIHISFKNMLAYNRLLSPDFYKYMIKEFKKWGKKIGIKERHRFWDRLLGGNRYCRPGYECDRQLLSSCDRYHQLNIHSYFTHKTIEFRFLPMFDMPKISILALYHLVSIVEAWLSACPREKSEIAVIRATRQDETTEVIKLGDMPKEYPRGYVVGARVRATRSGDYSCETCAIGCGWTGTIFRIGNSPCPYMVSWDSGVIDAEGYGHHIDFLELLPESQPIAATKDRPQS